MSNVKLIIGTICLIFTGIAYLYPKPFPENYNIVLVCTICYWLCSLIYYLFERKYSKDIFYSGYSKEFLDKYCKGVNKVSMVKVSSDVKDYCNEYFIWFDFEMGNNKLV